MTLVILMGVARRRQIVEDLVAGGLDTATPVVVIERASSDSQRTTRCSLGTLASVDVESPAVIVVGDVAGLDLGVVARAPDAARVRA